MTETENVRQPDEINLPDYRHSLQMSMSIKKTIDSGTHSDNNSIAETISEYFDTIDSRSDDQNTQIDSGIQVTKLCIFDFTEIFTH